jgi:7-cyano-7-deazaguanine synthase in queuosine biosynthesis
MKPITPSTIAVLSSGGVDSNVLVGEYAHHGMRVYPIYFEQGFRWERAERYWLKAYLQKNSISDASAAYDSSIFSA